MKRGLAAMLAVLVVAPSGAFAQEAPRKAGVVTVLEGDVKARRVALPAPLPLKFKDDVFLQDTVTTGEKSLTRMLLGGSAVVTVRERSVLTVTEVPDRTVTGLDTGKFALAVAREKLAAGRDYQVRTPNAIAGVRGTVVVTEVIGQPGAPASALTTKFYVLRGSIAVQQISPPGPPITVGAMQQATVTGNSTPSLGPITPAQVGPILAGLQPLELQGAGNVVQGLITNRALQDAVALAGVLANPNELIVQPPLPPTQLSGDDGQLIPQPTPFDIGQQEIAAVLPSPSSSPCPGCVRFSGQTLSISGTAFQSFTGSVSSTSPLPLIGFESSTANHSGSNSFFDVQSGTTITLAGPLVNLINSTITTSGAFLDITNGQIATTAPLITLDPSHIIAGNSLAILRGGALTLGGSLLTLSESTITSGGHGLDVFNGGVVTKTGPAPLFDLISSATHIAEMNVLDSLVSIEGTSTTRNVMALEGSLFRAVNAKLTGGNGLDILEGAILTKAPSTDTAPLFDLTGTTFTSGDALVNIWFSPSSATPSTLLLGDAPLLKASTSTLSFANNILYVETGVLSSTGSGALVDLTNSTVQVTNLGAFEIIFGSSVTLAGPLLSLSGGQFTAGLELLDISFNSNLTSSGAGALIQMVNGARGSVATGFVDVGGNSVASLAGPLLSMSGNSHLTMQSGLFVGSGGTFTGTSTAPLFTVDNSSLLSTSSLVQAAGAGSKVSLKGPILSAANNSIVSVSDSTSDVMSAIGGGVIDIANQTGPLVSFAGSSRLIAPRLLYAEGDGVVQTNGSTGPLFSFAGAAQFSSAGPDSAMQLTGFNIDPVGEVVEIDNGDGTDIVNFPAATDQPLQHAGAIVDADAATITTATGLLVDKALLQASAPLLNLKNGSSMSISGNGIDMVNQAKVVSLIGPLVKLDASTLNIAGHAVNLNSGSFLKVVNGDLISLNNGSVLTVGGHLLNLAGGSIVQINNGTVLTVNNSTATISGAFVNYNAGVQSTLSVTNSLTPAISCGNCGPLPIAFTNGALQSNVNVSGSAIQGNNSGILGSGAAILMNGPSAQLTITGNP
jgi:hypothetical protein